MEPWSESGEMEIDPTAHSGVVVSADSPALAWGLADGDLLFDSTQWRFGLEAHLLKERAADRLSTGSAVVGTVVSGTDGLLCEEGGDCDATAALCRTSRWLASSGSVWGVAWGASLWETSMWKMASILEVLVLGGGGTLAGNFTAGFAFSSRSSGSSNTVKGLAAPWVRFPFQLGLLVRLPFRTAEAMVDTTDSFSLRGEACFLPPRPLWRQEE